MPRQRSLQGCWGLYLLEDQQSLALWVQFDFVKFRRVCILSGCDYLPEGLPGVGLTKARAFFAKTAHPDLRRVRPLIPDPRMMMESSPIGLVWQCLKRIPLYLNMKKLTVTREFVEAFVQVRGHLSSPPHG